MADSFHNKTRNSFAKMLPAFTISQKNMFMLKCKENLRKIKSSHIRRKMIEYGR